MKYVVIDTCVILHILRNDDKGRQAVAYMDAQEDVQVPVISTVTKAELESLKKQHRWGALRCEALNTFLQQVTYVDINNGDLRLIEAYAQIDAYSKRKVGDAKGDLKPGSAVKMGKNDLWIAATANLLSAPLMTADGDFDHLNNVYLQLLKF